MYFIVGRRVNTDGYILSYFITDGIEVKEVGLQQVYNDYIHGNLPYLRDFNTRSGEVDFYNIDNSLLPIIFGDISVYKDIRILPVSVLRIIERNREQIGVKIVYRGLHIETLSINDILNLVNKGTIKLFNAKVVNNRIVMKYTGDSLEAFVNAAENRVNLETYNHNEFFIDSNYTLKGYHSIGYKLGKTIIIPDGVKVIGKRVFEGCEKIKHVIIPNSVTMIDKYAFRRSGLIDIKIPDSVKIIESQAFEGCYDLKNVRLSNNIEEIRWGLFKDCHKLDSLRIPDGVESIWNVAFEYCYELKDVYIPDSVVDFDIDYLHQVFFGCSKLVIHCSRQSAAAKYANDFNIKVVYNN